MDKYEETFSTWNKMALLYQEKFMDLCLYDESYDFICGKIIESGAVLDVGCGPGNIARYLLSKRPDLKLQGIDISENMVGLARKNNPTAKFTVMDCRNIEKLNKKFDAIVCGFCLPYLSQTECLAFLKAAGKMVNNTGVLYLSFVEGDPSDSGFKVGSNGDRVYFYYHRQAEIIKYLAHNNFTVLKNMMVKYGETAEQVQFHKVLIAKKGGAA